MEVAVGERCKAFAVAHKSDADHQAYISALLWLSSLSVIAKAETWQVTCFSFSPKSNSKSVYSLLCSVVVSSSSCSSS